jgi:hypothetical protein
LAVSLCLSFGLLLGLVPLFSFLVLEHRLSGWLLWRLPYLPARDLLFGPVSVLTPGSTTCADPILTQYSRPGFTLGFRGLEKQRGAPSGAQGVGGAG